MTERAIAACRPKVWPYGDVPETPIYTGSVDGECSKCGVVIIVGPKAQEALRDGVAVETMCFMCGALTLKEESPHADTHVRSLGNKEFG